MSEEAETPSLTPIDLYQMAIPHIIQSNSRVQSIISKEKKKQRVNIQFSVNYLNANHFLETLLGKNQ